jgi:hypothetical protein
MGMDVYGVAPKCEQGRYFRRSSWGWKPLWQYCEDQHPEIAELVESPFTNDGDGLNDQDAVRLANRLIADIESGIAADYISARNVIISATPNDKCECCEGTGVRRDQVGVDMMMPEKELPRDVGVRLGRSCGWCNECGGEGETASPYTYYKLEIDDIIEFAVFAARSGGFRIF